MVGADGRVDVAGWRNVLVGMVAVSMGLVVGCGPPPAGGGASPTGSVPAASLTQANLLAAEEMPAWNGAMGWAEGVPPAGEDVPTACTLPTAQSLGAVEVLGRGFRATGIDDPGTTPDPTWPVSYGSNKVTRFVDEGAADAGLAAWEDALSICAPPPGMSEAEPPRSYRISTLPSGSTWAISVPEPDACPECLRFEFVGVATKGTVVTVVAFGITGMDANYEEDPMADSMDASVARLP